MTSHVGRLYALATALLVFFVTWAAVAARPWATSSQGVDPRLKALAAREQRLRHESLVVRRVIQRRWAVYRVQLRRRNAQIASAHRAQLAAATAPPVRVVNLPPLTVTRTA
jgi:hypothetical protein